MKGRKVFLVFLFLLIIPLLHTNAYEEIDKSSVERYARHLIFIYNEKADKDPDFNVEDYKDEMCLYIEGTDSLRVLCFFGNVDNDSIIFFFDKDPYGKSFTGVVIEFLFEYDVYGYFPFYIQKNISIYNPEGIFNYSDTIISPELIRCSSFNDIFNNTEYSSKVLAEQIYSDNKKIAKINEILEPFIEKYGDVIASDSNLHEEYKRIYKSSFMANYSFNDFLQDFEKFKEDVMIGKYGIWYIILNNGFYYSNIFLIINILLLSIGIVIEEKIKNKHKIPKTITTTLTTLFTFVYLISLTSNPPNNYHWILYGYPYLAIPIVYISYYILTGSKKKKKEN